MSEATDLYDQANGLDFDLDLSQEDTSYPSLRESEVEMIIQKAEVQPWKNSPQNKSLVLTLATTSIQTSTKGEDLAPGFRQTYRLNLQQGYDKQGEPIGDFKKDIARFLDACKAGRQFNMSTIQALLGKTVKAVIKKRKDPSDGYGETEVKYLKSVD